MSHDLDVTDGVYSFADSLTDGRGRVDAWHKHGQAVGHCMTAQEVMKEAHLGNWRVHKVPLVGRPAPIITEDGVTTEPELEIPDKFASARFNPITGAREYLGIVGNVWEPIQNEAICEMLNMIVDESGAHFETAGALAGGARAFVTMKMPQSIELRDNAGNVIDTTDMYLSGLNAHDGMNALRAIVTGTRIVCANTETMAIAGAKSTFSIHHTPNYEKAMKEARKALGLTFKYMEAFEAEVQKLYAQAMSDEQMKTFATQVMKVDKAETERQATSRRAHADNIVKLWTSSPTLDNVRGTKWAAYNAVTEYTDFYAPVKGHGDPADLRALRALTPASVNQNLKIDAFRLLTTV
jgi:phage/plasmid-like protein (TIGR03299 family)